MLRRNLVRQSGSRSVGSQGFSIIELLVAMAILTIVAGVGVPALLNKWSRVKLEATASNIAILMHQARLRSIGQFTANNANSAKDRWPHGVVVVGDEVHILRVTGEDPLVTEIAFQFQFTDTSAEIYDADDTICESEDIFYDLIGNADDPGQVCIWDGRNNILEIGLLLGSGPPKIRKYLFAPDSPTGTADLFEKISASTSVSIWAWY